MPDRLKVIMHVGLHRTGTTSIQRFLATAKAELLERGFVYPILKGKTNHHKIVADCYFGKQIELFEQFVEAALEGDRSRQVLLSSEEFSTMFHDAEFSRKFIDLYSPMYDFRIIVCFRRQDYLYESIFRELVKDGSPRNIYVNDFYDFDHWRRFKKLVETFGISALTCYGYSAGNAVRNFLTAVGISDLADGAALSRYLDNRSMHRRKALCIASFAEFALRDRSAFVKRIMGSNSIADDGQKFIMSPRERAFIFQTYQEGNTRLAGELGVRRGDITPVEPTADEDWFPAAPLTPYESARLTVELWNEPAST